MNKLEIRKAIESDCSIIMELIRELAIYEKMENEVVGNVETLYDSLFVKKEAHAILGIEDGVVVGFALYFFNFSTFETQKGLYLEDLFVKESHRGKGYGKALLLHLTSIALEHKCRRMEWVVLDWNELAINFYKSLGAFSLSEWTVYRLDHKTLLSLQK